MTNEFFTDVEINTVSTALSEISLDLDKLARRVHDHSRQRLVEKLRKAQHELGIVLRAIDGK